MNNSFLYSHIIKLLELQTLALKVENTSLSVIDVATFYLEVILKKTKVLSFQKITQDILSIKPNIVIEYINTKLITDKKVTLDDFKEMFENNDDA